MYSPRHARPSCLPLRAAVTTSLTAVLLPIALAAPALAEDVTPTGTTTADTTGSEATAPAVTAPAATTATTTETTAATAVVADPRRTASLTVGALPIGADRKAQVTVRLLSEGQNVPNEPVAVERYYDGTWHLVARLVTNESGVAVGRLPFAGQTRIRATYAGSLSNTSAVSPHAIVRERTAVAMRMFAGETNANGTARLVVRLLDVNGAAIRRQYVFIEAQNSDGSWRYLGKQLTDGSGHAVRYLPFSRNTRVRAFYQGDTYHRAGRTQEAIVRRVTLGDRAVRIAAEQQGKPYQYGAVGPNSFDCSGFTTYIYKTRLGRSIPRTSAQQAAYLPRVAQSAKRPGDLLFFRTGGRVTHVAVYAGGGKMWAAPRSGTRVKLQAIYTSSYTVGRVS